MFAPVLRVREPGAQQACWCCAPSSPPGRDFFWQTHAHLVVPLGTPPPSPHSLSRYARRSLIHNPRPDSMRFSRAFKTPAVGTTPLHLSFLSLSFSVLILSRCAVSEQRREDAEGEKVFFDARGRGETRVSKICWCNWLMAGVDLHEELPFFFLLSIWLWRESQIICCKSNYKTLQSKVSVSDRQNLTPLKL